MSAGHGYLIIGVQFVLNALVCFGCMLVMAFADEANRGRPLPALSTALLWLALLIVLAPVIVAVLVFVAQWRASEQLPTLMLWSPFLAAVIAIPLFMAAMHGSSKVATRSREEAERLAIEEIRSPVRAGSDERVCELVNRDPRATADEMNRCFAKLARLQGEALWRELQWFFPNRQFSAWSAQQLGLSEGGDNRWIPVVPPERQSGFLKLFFEAWMARPDFLQSRQDRIDLTYNITQVFSAQEWSEEARAAMRASIVPELRRRLSGASTLTEPEDSDDLSNARILEHLDSQASENPGG